MSADLAVEYPQIVLEGGPGQGKSTITQYVAQVYRARFLGRDEDVQNIPAFHRLCPSKLPFRIDLRDYAKWLAAETRLAKDESRTPILALERFISRQIEVASGGFDFAVADFADVIVAGFAIIMLDSFDEVADVKIRRVIINEVSAASTRLLALGKRCQILVTSRPTAFVNAPSFSDSKWRHIDLDSVERSQVGEYLSRWVKAKKLSTQEIKTFGAQVMQRMSENHIAELAKNPMQLAILLALMWAQGNSLPDKRTALYRGYVDLFLNREAEKDLIIKEYRDLILEIHGHIAWILQTRVERDEGDGRISEDDLLSAIRDYVDKEQHDGDIVLQLFQALRQRVVAIVSRVEGTYEFEVQPLREFFAGQYLYDTAPYSPSGSECAGTLPDRFAAICRSPYWSNVTRFYAGCYSKGELSNLSDGLSEFMEDPELGLISTPAALTLTLIADWVFSQAVPAMRRLLTQITEPNRLRVLATQIYSRNPRSVPRLPDRCGRDAFLEACKNEFRRCTRSDERVGFAQLIRANSDEGERYAFWAERRSELDDDLAWVHEGAALGVYSDTELDIDLVKSLASHEELLRDTELSAIWGDMYFEDDIIYQAAVENALNSSDTMYFHRSTTIGRAVVVSILSCIAQTDVFGTIMRGKSDESFWNYLGIADGDIDDGSLTEEVKVWASDVSDYLMSPLEEWRTDPEIWDALLLQSVSVWGNSWSFMKLALIGAAAVEVEEAESAELDDPEVPLIDRLRFARKMQGAEEWWARGLYNAADDGITVIKIAALVLWAGADTVMQIAGDLSEIIDRMDSRYYAELLEIIGELRSSKLRTGGMEELTFDKFKSLPPRFICLIFDLANDAWRNDAFAHSLLNYDGANQTIHSKRSSYGISRAVDGALSWTSALEVVETAYSNGAIGVPPGWFSDRARATEMSVADAGHVLMNASRYPMYMVNQANHVLQSSVDIERVTDISRRQNWFC